MDIPFLPAELSKIVIHWVYELIRFETIERVQHGRTIYSDILRLVHEDIRSNVPTYAFHILTQSSRHIVMSLSLPSCDPNKVRTDLRIPESHNCSWKRKVLATSVNRQGINVIYTE
jgi:hypothetical protein